MTRSELTNILRTSKTKHDIRLAVVKGNAKLLDLLTEQLEISLTTTEYVGYTDGRSPDLSRSYTDLSRSYLPATRRYPVVITYVAMPVEKLISNMTALDKIPMDGLYCYQDGIFKALKEDESKMTTSTIQL